MNKRTDLLLDLMDKEGIDALIMTDTKNMHYYSGFYNGEGYIVISKSGFYVVTDSRYTEYAENVCEGFEVKDITKHKPADFLCENQRVGFEDKSISYERYFNLSKQIKNLVPIGNMALSLRETKDENEINLIKKAVKISDDAFSHICSYIKIGMTEKEIAAEIDCYMKKHGADDSSFPTIVAAGERGSLPHAIPSERKIKEGDLIVMDFGCLVDGYMSDMTRTVAAGEISKECKKIYDTVLCAQLEAVNNVRAGIKGCEADKFARDILDSQYPGAFGHSLGHSVGLDIHECPNLSPKNDKLLCKNNIVTVEPGVYIPSLCGVRIEDMVRLTDEGCEIFTSSPKELIYVG